ncbi:MULTISPECIES: hypothetical protein [Hyphobacterium]|uniref:DUF1475 domain-containing protein n=1 Tax=Hyphobacterium vulgare TaxID=1736751 RepID=A0ABV6ZXY2_9PROT
MKILQLLPFVAALVLAALIIWAAGAGDFMGFGAVLLSDPWGVVTLADLYIGFLFAALIIWFSHDNKLVAILWILPLPVLGNVWTGIWFAIHLPRIVRALRDARRGNTAGA